MFGSIGMPDAEVQISPCLHIISIVIARESERMPTVLYAYAVGRLYERQLYVFETPARSCRQFVNLCDQVCFCRRRMVVFADGKVYADLWSSTSRFQRCTARQLTTRMVTGRHVSIDMAQPANVAGLTITSDLVVSRSFFTQSAAQK